MAIPGLITVTTPTPRRFSFGQEELELHEVEPSTPPRDQDTTSPSRLLESPFADKQAWVSPERKSSTTPSPSQGGGGPRRSVSFEAEPRRLDYTPQMEVQEEMDEIDKMHDEDFFHSTPKKRELLQALELDYRSESRMSEIKLEKPPAPFRAVTPPWQPPRPTNRLLFRFVNRSDILYNLIPGFVLALISAGIPPIMTLLIGYAFAAFTEYPLDPSLATPEQKHKLISDVSRFCLYLTLSGLGIWVLEALMGVFWARFGELAAHRVRRQVYDSVMAKDMGWFDAGMGLQQQQQQGDELSSGGDNGNVGAGGLMANFTRETDDVRLAMGSNLGAIVQTLGVFLGCFILALSKSWSLTLVVVAAVPIVVIWTAFIDGAVRKQVQIERTAVGQASTTIERNVSNIATVKAFNAQQIEVEKLRPKVKLILRKQIVQAWLWGGSLGFTQICLTIMFVAGPWYGITLVTKNKISPGDVMTVFWASMLGTANLQKVVPHLVLLTNGKVGMANLVGLLESPSPPKGAGRPASGGSAGHKRSWSDDSFEDRIPIHRRSRYDTPTELRGIRPMKAIGEIDLRHVFFAYPSRPDTLALDDVSLFLPAGETTFIVGGSGSGKSTIAQLLLRLYDPDQGQMLFDDQDMRFLDSNFMREHVSAIQQGCVLFDMSVHDNVAMGLSGSPARKPSDATRQEVVEACKMAMIHDFIEGLPEGYDTRLGTKASSLSGGQRQRLAIARARLRDPTILVLDEATSALDATSRIQVFEAVRRWRNNRMTICITHDLSQVRPDDFVYVMKEGRMVEQGFRSDLIRKDNSEFGRMATLQAAIPLPLEDRDHWNDAEDAEEILDFLDGYMDDARTPRNRNSIASAFVRPESSYLAYLPYVSKNDSPGRASTMATPDRPSSRFSRRISTLTPPVMPGASPRPPSRRSNHSPLARPASGLSQRPRTISRYDSRRSRVIIPDGDQFSISDTEQEASPPKPASFFALYRAYLPTVPHKFLILVGVILAIAQGVLTPVWSKYVALLLSNISGTEVGGSTTILSLKLLGITVASGLAAFGAFTFFDILVAYWGESLRLRVFDLVLAQEQGWFDRPENASSRIVHRLMKDVEDMKELMSTLISRSLTIVAMIGLGIIWAFAIDWHLTLVGLAIGPILGAFAAVQIQIAARYEATNKLAREQVSKTFYEGIANVRSIRALAFEEHFKADYEESLTAARKTGDISAWVKGIGTGASLGLVYFAQALMIFVGAELIKLGLINYATMIQVYSLVLFSVQSASGLLDFVPMVAKAQVAARDFMRLHQLNRDNSEQQGDLRFPIDGPVAFENVSFAYPTRPDDYVLRQLSLRIEPGECVCLVGPSGCGKSTVAGLLQRLYEPLTGSIRLNGQKLAQADHTWLRDHIGLVSQSAQLFDASVSENIAYGNQAVSQSEIERAAKAANVHDFVLSLPQGYETNLGENASLISGGQAQRLQIARALLRRSNILILDECTSALDADNQKAILDNLMRVKDTRTTIFITHKADVMRRCDRVLCLSEGKIAEQGTYDELMRRGGVFAELMTSGEVE